MNIIWYKHHNKNVAVLDELKGMHGEFCLCYKCAKLNINDREKNCPIASELYQLCVKHNLVTPVFECPEFEENGIAILE